MYTGYNFDFERPLFDVLELRFSKTKDVVVRLKIKNKGEALSVFIGYRIGKFEFYGL